MTYLPYQAYPPQQQQPNPYETDLAHLKTLSICHYVWGGLSMAISSIFLIHVVLGILIISGAMNLPSNGRANTSPPAFFGWMFIAFGSLAVLIGWTIGILTILSGRYLAQRRNRTFSMVMAGVNCLSVPIGTTLGVFTFVVLSRQTVQSLYAYEASSRETTPPASH